MSDDPSAGGDDFDESDPSLDFPLWIIGNPAVAKAHGFPAAAYMPVHETRGLFLPVFRDEDAARLFIERRPLEGCVPVEIDPDRWLKLLARLQAEGGTCVGIDLQAEPGRRAMFVGLDWCLAHPPRRKGPDPH